MCRLNEVLQMKYKDIQLNQSRPHSQNPPRTITYGCFTIRDRKTDHDLSASRPYSLHRLPRDERAAEALTYISQWSEFATREMHHQWTPDDFAFPALTKIPRNHCQAVKRQRMEKEANPSQE
ncbi:hypothetical protein PINS_up016468 [Pythium insidiosum]|nr:hypothetical protein PINS_up016468 [Pythium insidiosum]